LDIPLTTYPSADALEFEDIQVGMEFGLEHTFSNEDVWQFAQLSGDYSPLHVDPVYASMTEFGQCVVHGILLASLFSQLVGMRIPGKPALYLGQDLTFRRTVLVGETVRANAKVTAKTESTRSIILATEIRTADNRVAVSGSAKVKIRDSGITTANQTANASRVANAQVAVIAGGTGGIGAGIAGALVEQGVAIALLYHANQSRADRVLSELAKKGGAAIAIKTDVTEAVQVISAFEQIVDTLGEPGIVINAATSAIGQRAAIDLERVDFQRHLDTQVHAVMEVSRAAHPFMKKAGGGSIVNIASQVAADVPPPRMADYVTAKYALIGLSKALAIEWAEDNIRVNMVSPGLIQTELTEYYHDRIFKMEAARTPLKRLATVADVARAVAFLVNKESGFITGVNLSITGGQVML
jgi:3-oxoacyl-[acyl-carrier protein] reductase